MLLTISMGYIFSGEYVLDCFKDEEQECITGYFELLNFLMMQVSMMFLTKASGFSLYDAAIYTE